MRAGSVREEIKKGKRGGIFAWIKNKKKKKRNREGFGAGQFKVEIGEGLKREYQQQPGTFDEWRSVRGKKVS